MDTIVAKLNGAINDVLALPDVKEKLATQFMQVDRRSPAETKAYFDSEVKTWRTMTTTIGLTLN